MTHLDKNRGIKRINVRIAPDIYEALRGQAIEAEGSITSLVNRMLRSTLGLPSPQAFSKEESENQS